MIMPGTFDRILTMAEKEQASKINLDRDSLDAFIHSKRSISTSVLRGQLFGFVSVVMYFVILAITVIMNNMAMFTALFCVGAFASLPALVRSFQKKQEKS